MSPPKKREKRKPRAAPRPEPTSVATLVSLSPRDSELLRRCLGQPPTPAASASARAIAPLLEKPATERGGRFVRVTTGKRARFDCGLSPLNDALKGPPARGLTRWALTAARGSKIMGFYALHEGFCVLAPLGDHGELRAMGRLAVRHLRALATDLGSRRQGAGRALCLHAIAEACRPASPKGERPLLLIADALNQRAAHFYETFGFIPFPDQPHVLFLPLDWVRGEGVAARAEVG